MHFTVQFRLQWRLTIFCSLDTGEDTLNVSNLRARKHIQFSNWRYNYKTRSLHMQKSPGLFSHIRTLLKVHSQCAKAIVTYNVANKRVFLWPVYTER